MITQNLPQDAVPTVEQARVARFMKDESLWIETLRSKERVCVVLKHRPTFSEPVPIFVPTIIQSATITLLRFDGDGLKGVLDRTRGFTSVRGKFFHHSERYWPGEVFLLPDSEEAKAAFIARHAHSWVYNNLVKRLQGADLETLRSTWNFLDAAGEKGEFDDAI